MEGLVGAVVGDKNAITILRINEGIYIENKSDTVQLKREILGLAGKSFIKINEANELVEEIKRYKPEAIGIVYNTISDLMEIYKILDEHSKELGQDLADMQIYAELRTTETELRGMTGLETTINTSLLSTYPNIIDEDLKEVGIDIHKYNKYKLKYAAEAVGSLMKHYYKIVVCIRKMKSTNLLFGNIRYSLRNTTYFSAYLGTDYGKAVNEIAEHINENYKYFEIKESSKYEQSIMSGIEYTVSKIPLTIIQKWADRRKYSSYGANVLAIEQVGETYRTKALCNLINTLYKKEIYISLINIDELDYRSSNPILSLVYAKASLNEDEIALVMQETAQKCEEEITKEIEDKYRKEKEQFNEFYKALEN